MAEPSLHELEVEALRGSLSAAATEEEVSVRVHRRWRSRRRGGRMQKWETVGEEVAKWHWRWEAARRRRGRRCGAGGGGEADCEVGQRRELAVHVFDVYFRQNFTFR